MPQRHQVMPRRHQVMPRRNQLSHEGINYAMKTLVMPQRHQSATKTWCQDTNVTKTTAFG